MFNDLISCVTVQEVGRLDCAMTNREARPHLVKSHKGMQSPAFKGYEYEFVAKECEELQWARKMGIDVRDFTLSYDRDVRSGYVLVMLMGGLYEYYLDLGVATYYATRGKLTHLDEFISVESFGEIYAYTALTKACDKGYLEIVKCLLAAGADKEKDASDGLTPLIWAAIWGHVEIVQLLLSYGADKERTDIFDETVLSHATSKGLQEIVQLLQSADPQIQDGK